MANVNSQNETVDASGQKRLPPGNFLYLIAATSAVTISLQKGGSTEIFANAIGGLQLGRVKGWDYAFLLAAPGTVITFYYGNTQLREDVTVLQQQIATIAGTVPVVLQPGSTVADVADTAQATATQTVIAANLLRKRITIGVSPAAANHEPVRVSGSGGAGKGIVIQPGTYQEFDTTASLTVRNDNTLATGLGTNWYSFEEA